MHNKSNCTIKGSNAQALLRPRRRRRRGLHRAAGPPPTTSVAYAVGTGSERQGTPTTEWSWAVTSTRGTRSPRIESSKYATSTRLGEHIEECVCESELS